MAFLRNRAVNWVNLHSGIQSLAEGMGGVFVLVFLLRAGVSVPASLCAMALIFAARFAFRPAVLVAAKRFGLKPLVVGGTLAVAVRYPLLANVHGVDGTLLGYCLLVALGGTFYWTSYHAYFTLLGDTEHRGHQISAQVALSAVVGIVAPLCGAWALVHLGAGRAFGAVGVIQALAAVPLLATPNLQVPQTAPGAFRAALPGVGMFMADGWFDVNYMFVWQIGLFFALGQSLSAYGGAMALSALVAAVSGLLLGRHIDAGHGRQWSRRRCCCGRSASARRGSPSARTRSAPSPRACSAPRRWCRSTTSRRNRRARCASTSRPKVAGTSAAARAVSSPRC